MKIFAIFGFLCLTFASGLPQYPMPDYYDGGVLLANPPVRPMYNRQLFYWNPYNGPNPTIGYKPKPTPRLVNQRPDSI